MENASQSFNLVLQQYVFMAAYQVIELANPATQSELMGLINRLDKTSGPVQHSAASAGLPTSQSVESEWQSILKKPIDWQSVNSQYLASVIRQQIKRNQDYVAQLKHAIQTTEQHLQRVQNTFLGDPQRSALIHWYKQMLGQYQQLLARNQKRSPFSFTTLTSLADRLDSK